MATLNCVLHPHHVNMGKHHTSIYTLHQHIEDPYYGLEKKPSHKDVSVPRFDVREDEIAFYLDGDVPGISAPGELFTEVIDGITLIIRGSVKSKEGTEHAKISEQHANEEAKAAGVLHKESEAVMIWRLKERHLGRFERSFTFPSHFKYGSMEIKLDAGVVSIKLLKDLQVDKDVVVKLEIGTQYPSKV